MSIVSGNDYFYQDNLEIVDSFKVFVEKAYENGEISSFESDFSNKVFSFLDQQFEKHKTPLEFRSKCTQLCMQYLKESHKQDLNIDFFKSFTDNFSTKLCSSSWRSDDTLLSSSDSILLARSIEAKEHAISKDRQDAADKNSLYQVRSGIFEESRSPIPDSVDSPHQQEDLLVVEHSLTDSIGDDMSEQSTLDSLDSDWEHSFKGSFSIEDEDSLVQQRDNIDIRDEYLPQPALISSPAKGEGFVNGTKEAFVHFTQARKAMKKIENSINAKLSLVDPSDFDREELKTLQRHFLLHVESIQDTFSQIYPAFLTLFPGQLPNFSRKQLDAIVAMSVLKKYYAVTKENNILFQKDNTSLKVRDEDKILVDFLLDQPEFEEVKKVLDPTARWKSNALTIAETLMDSAEGLVKTAQDNQEVDSKDLVINKKDLFLSQDSVSHTHHLDNFLQQIAHIAPIFYE